MQPEISEGNDRLMINRTITKSSLLERRSELELRKRKIIYREDRDLNGRRKCSINTEMRGDKKIFVKKQFREKIDEDLCENPNEGPNPIMTISPEESTNGNYLSRKMTLPTHLESNHLDFYSDNFGKGGF
jgi:hypothetical protein